MDAASPRPPGKHFELGEIITGNGTLYLFTTGAGTGVVVAAYAGPTASWNA